jgi:ADP-heptose:LPS heptosyltransferase
VTARPGRHVLVARLDNDGDVLLAGPAVRAVAAGARRVTLLCSPAARPAAALLPGVDEIVTFEAPWVPADPPAFDPAAALGLVGRLSTLDLDQGLILTSFHQSPLPMALLLRMARVSELAAISVDYPGALLDVRHRVCDDIHEVERNLSLVATLGYHLPPGDDGRLRILGPPEPRPDALPPRPYVVVHPGASVPARAWSPAANTRLVARLAELGRAVVVTGGPSERDLCARVAAGAPGTVDLSGATDLAGLAGVLAGADAVVVGNTGPAHLAAAVGTPVVSIYAPTVPAGRWRPWRVPHVVLGAQDIGCAGCRSRVCPMPEQPCLAGIEVDDVVAAVALLTAGRSLEPV